MKSSWIPIVLIVVLVVALVIRHRPRRPGTKASQPVPNRATISTSAPATTADAESDFAPEALADVDRCIADGKEIQAIKVVREQTGWDLVQAKEWVDARTAGR